MMEITGGRGVASEKGQRQLAKILRAHEPLDHGKFQRQRLQKTLLKVVPIDSDAGEGIDTLRTNPGRHALGSLIE